MGKHLFKIEKRNYSLIEDVFRHSSYFNMENELYAELEPKNIILSRIKNILNDEMCDVLRLRYDLDDTGKYYTFKEISENLKIKIEPVRQRVQKALRILRHPKNSKQVFLEYHAYKSFLKIQEGEYNYDYENNKSLLIGYVPIDKAFGILRGKFKPDSTSSNIMLKIIEIYDLLSQSCIEGDKKNLFITDKTGFLKVFLGLDFQIYKALYVNDLQNEINSELLIKKNEHEFVKMRIAALKEAKTTGKYQELKTPVGDTVYVSPTGNIVDKTLYMDYLQGHIDEKSLKLKSSYKFTKDEDLFKSIEEFELSIRAANCLKSANIEMIYELVQKTEGEMFKIKGFGRKSLNEIKEVLSTMGLSFGMKLY